MKPIEKQIREGLEKENDKMKMEAMQELEREKDVFPQERKISLWWWLAVYILVGVVLAMKLLGGEK